MGKVDIQLDSAGLAETINEPWVWSMVGDAVAKVAGAAAASGYRIESRVEPAKPGRIIRDGRPIGRVVLAETNGVGIQAKNGVLTRAVSVLGGSGVQIKGAK